MMGIAIKRIDSSSKKKSDHNGNNEENQGVDEMETAVVPATDTADAISV